MPSGVSSYSIPHLKVNLFLTSKGLLHVAKLIGCDVEDLKLTLSTRKMKVGNDNIVQKLTLPQVKYYCVKSLHLSKIMGGKTVTS